MPSLRAWSEPARHPASDHFDELLDEVRARTPARRLVQIEEVGRVAAFLASGAGAPLSGSVVYADNGFHSIAGDQYRSATP
jgi:enoyl-[acyl-carrier-protein] reductase (NADH)